jgi:3-methyladenine DNA glycosylase AlkD
MTILEDLLQRMHELADPSRLPGMARYGIVTSAALGISLYELRKLARNLSDHILAEQLWQTGIHEARLLASMVDDPAQVTSGQMERWVVAFNSWDLCDQVSTNLFDRCPLAVEKVYAWSTRPGEYVKRAAFAMIAGLAVHSKDAGDDLFLGFLPLIERESGDDRNYVKKAVNWALRNIGKKNVHLRQAAIACAQSIRQQDSRSARWIASDALRELVLK